MSFFTAYWAAYATASEAADDQKPGWSGESLDKGIVRAALVCLGRMLSNDAIYIPELSEQPSGVLGESTHHIHSGYRVCIAGIEEISQVSLPGAASDLVEMSREALCLCVVPTTRLPLWSLIAEEWPARTASVVPLFPLDLDALGSGKVELLDLIQFKLYRYLVLDKPEPGTQFDPRLFAEFASARSGSRTSFDNLQDVLSVDKEDDHRWVDHPLVGRVRASLERGRGCLLVGPSSSGKSVLAFQVGQSFFLGGEHVGYINLGLVESSVAALFSYVSARSPHSSLSVLIIDDLQSNPAVARYLLSLASAGRRAALSPPPVLLGISWVDFSSDAVTWFEDCLPLAVRSYQVRQRIAGHYREILPEDDIEALLQSCGDDIFLLRLSLEHSKEQRVRIGRSQLAELVWLARTQGSGVSDEEARRVGLVAASLGRFDISAQPGFLRHEARVTAESLQSLTRSGLLRRHQAALSIGHRSLSALLADWLADSGGWTELDTSGGARAPGILVLNYLRSLGSSLAVDSLRALHARAGFKDRPRLNKRAAALVEIWDAFNAVLERIEHQQLRDSSWGHGPASAMFATMAFAEVGKTDLARDSIAFLRRHWRSDDDGFEVVTLGLSSTDDFVQIKIAMKEEDESGASDVTGQGWTAQEVDIDLFHRTWVSGVILCTEAAAQDERLLLQMFLQFVEGEQLESGAFYPERVPWSTARVLLGLAVCGRTVDTSAAVGRAVKWLLRDRRDGGACSGGLWHSGTGRWNSTLETTGMVLLALGAVGYDCADERLDTARAYLLSQKNRWTAPGKELDGALAIQALLDTGSSWEDIASEAQVLSRWAKGEAFWQSAVRSAKDSLDQSCRVAQIAAHLVSIGWTAIRTDLPAFLDALASPDLGRAASVSQEAAGKTRYSLPSEDKIPESVKVDLELEALRKMAGISLAECSVVGDYRRYDERTRHALRDWRNRLMEPFKVHAAIRANFLIWAAPGSGKSFFIQEIAAALGSPARYFELNLARLSREEFSHRLVDLRGCGDPVLCLLDEIDARSEEAWPYEECFSDLDLNLSDSRTVVFVLIGSSSSGMQGMLRGMVGRSKGQDLLDRIPAGNRFEIPALSLEDRVVVVVSQVLSAARRRGQRFSEIERLALYYTLKNSDLRTPRQLRELAVSGVERMSAGDGRLKYDDLFARGDNRDKLFWVSNQDAAAELSNTFLKVTDVE